MRVCLIGDNSEPLDEGMKKVTRSLERALVQHCEVLVLNPLQAMHVAFWRGLSRYRPHIIHYIPGPSLRSFVLLSLARRRSLAKTVMSLTHPDPALPRRLACRLLGPDLLLAQSLRTKKKFENLGCELGFLPNGVDTRRFRPVSATEKSVLRDRYGLPKDDFVVLHVGNTRRIRNLLSLVAVQQLGCQVLIVSSTTVQGDPEVDTRLKEAGCLVWNRYIESVEEVYALADCYLFPTRIEVAAIEHPLSVLEAMATNLPIVSTKFGALPQVLNLDNGIRFYDTDDELLATIKCIRRNDTPIKTRSQSMHFDWHEIAERLLSMYRDLRTRN